MVFASPIFLFAFLPLALALYFATPNRARNFTLLCLSLAFYTWGEHEWVMVMLTSIAFNWLGAMGVEWLRAQSTQAAVAIGWPHRYEPRRPGGVQVLGVRARQSERAAG